MPFATDYIDVASRIVEFRAKYPEGTLQAEVIRWPEEGFPFIAVMAHAYRTDDDMRPGVGLAYEPFPGKTNFTRDSELQNAETSAWGRALVAVGAADTKRGIASAEEVRNRSASEDSAPGSHGGTERDAGGSGVAEEGASGSSAQHLKPEPHAPDMHAVKAGSSLTRCAYAGCPVAGKATA